MSRPTPKHSRLVRRALAAAATAALAWLAVSVAGPGGAAASGRPAADAVAPLADEAPGYAVEDFGYPGADKILAEQGITLKRGDGHIVLADCGSQSGLLQVWARSKAEICFRVTGDSGYLSLEIPSVYGVQGNAYSTQVDMTVDDEEKTYDVPENGWAAVGESADDQGREWMLVEIRTSK
ncbi:hypothetical protein ACFV23_45505 [Streptomyces sp. NPDC059627]